MAEAREEVRWVNVSNGRLWSARTGQGLPLAMLHGGPGMWDYMGPVAATIDDLATVYRFDQRGCGRSVGEPPYDVSGAVADMDAVRAAWGVERWAVLGHSWGATLALAYAAAHPGRTTALVYVSGTGVDAAWHEAYRTERMARLSPSELERWHELRALRRSATGEELARVEAEYARLYHSTDLGDRSRVDELLRWVHSGGFEVNQRVNRELGEDASRAIENAAFAALVRALRVPTLVVHGEVDPRPARFAAALAGFIDGAEVALMPGVGHFPRFEAPDEFKRIVRAFLGRVLG